MADLTRIVMLGTGDFALRNTPDAAALGAGMLVLAVFSARHFGRFHGGNTPERR